LAQVQLPGDTDLDSVKRKLAYDLYYVKNLNPWLDLRIILSTCLKVLGVSFRKLRRWFALPSSQVIEFYFNRHFFWFPVTSPEAGDPFADSTATFIECGDSAPTIIALGNSTAKTSLTEEVLPVHAEPRV
jgi:hypothetical protein